MTAISDLPDLDVDVDDPAPDVDGRDMTSQRTRIALFDGTEFTVRVSQRDRVQWDLVAPKKKWGKATDVPFLAQTFITFAAAKREGHIEGMSWETFRESIDVMEEIPVEESDVIRPTSRNRSPGRS